MQNASYVAIELTSMAVRGTFLIDICGLDGFTGFVTGIKLGQRR